jgi:hypothetical protein
MLLQAELAQNWPIPPVDRPGPGDELALRERAAPLAQAISWSLSTLSTGAVACRFTECQFRAGGEASAAAVVISWPLCELHLNEQAAAAILAGLLGAAQLAPAASLNPTDLALLELSAQELAQRINAALGLPLPAVPQVRSSGAQENPQQGLVAYDFELEFAGGAQPLTLLIFWEDARNYLALPPPDQPVGLAVEALTSAVLCLEAILPGPTLTAQELLELQPGDVARLGSNQREALLVVEGVPLATGRAGARNGKLAVNISKLAGRRG